MLMLFDVEALLESEKNAIQTTKGVKGQWKSYLICKDCLDTFIFFAL